MTSLIRKRLKFLPVIIKNKNEQNKNLSSTYLLRSQSEII